MPGKKTTRKCVCRVPNIAVVVVTVIVVLIHLPQTDGQSLGLPPSRSFPDNVRNSQAHIFPARGQATGQGPLVDQPNENRGINLADSFFLNRIRQGDSDAIVRLGEMRQTVDTPSNLLHNFFQAFSRPNPRQRTGLFSLLHNLAVARGFLPNSLAVGSNGMSNHQPTETQIQNRNADLTSGGSNSNAENNVRNNNRMFESSNNIPVSNLPRRVLNRQITNRFQNRSIVPTSVEVVDSREVDIAIGGNLPNDIGSVQGRDSFGRDISSFFGNDVFRTENQGNSIIPNANSGLNTNAQNVNAGLNRESANVPIRDSLTDQGHPVNNLGIREGIPSIQDNFRLPNHDGQRNANSQTRNNAFNGDRPSVLIVNDLQNQMPDLSISNTAPVVEGMNRNSPNVNLGFDRDAGNVPLINSLPNRRQEFLMVDRSRGIGGRNDNARNVNVGFNTDNANIPIRDGSPNRSPAWPTLNPSRNTNQVRGDTIVNLASTGSDSTNVGNSIVIGRNVILDPGLANMNVGSTEAGVQRNANARTFEMTRRRQGNTRATIVRNSVAEPTFEAQPRTRVVLNANVEISSENSTIEPVFLQERRKVGGRFSAPPLEKRRGFLREGPDQARVQNFPRNEGAMNLNDNTRGNMQPVVTINRTMVATNTKLHRMSSVHEHITQRPSVTSFPDLFLPQGVPVSSVSHQNDQTTGDMLTTSVNMRTAIGFNSTTSSIQTDRIHENANSLIGDLTTNPELTSMFSNTPQASISSMQPSSVIDSINFREMEPQARNQNTVPWTSHNTLGIGGSNNFGGNDVMEATTAHEQSTIDFILQKVGHIELDPADHVLQFVGDMNLTLAEPEYNIQIVGDLKRGRKRQFVMEVKLNGSSQTNKELLQEVGNNDVVSGEKFKVHGNGEVRLVTRERVVIERIGFVKLHKDPSPNPADKVLSVLRIESLNHANDHGGILFLGNETNVLVDDKSNETVLQFVGDVISELPQTREDISQSNMADFNNISADFNANHSDMNNNSIFDIGDLAETSNNLTRQNLILNSNQTFTPEVPLALSSSASIFTGSELSPPTLSEARSTTVKRQVIIQNDTKSMLNIVLKPIGRIFTTVGTKADISKDNIVDFKEIG